MPLLAAALTILGVAAPAAEATPTQPPGATVQIAGNPEQGADVVCDPGDWSSMTPITFTYAWFKADNKARANPVLIGGATRDNYILTSNEVGKVVYCEVTASDTGGPAAPVESDDTLPTFFDGRPNISFPSSALEITQFSTTVKLDGYPGQNLTCGGGAPTIDLQRHDQTVSSTCLATDNFGNATADLAPPNRPADSRDVLQLNTGIGPIAATDLFSSYDVPTVDQDGLDFHVDNCVDCERVQVRITRPGPATNTMDLEHNPNEGGCQSGGFGPPPPGGGGSCNWSTRGNPIPGGVVGNDDVVDVIVTLLPQTSPGARIETSRASLRGANGRASCSADRTTGVARCDNLDLNQNYDLTRDPLVGSNVTVANVPVDGAGGADFQFSALLAGDQLMLKRNGSTVAPITTLQVHTLSMTVNDGIASGTCQPRKWRVVDNAGQDPCDGAGNYGNEPVSNADVVGIRSDDDTSGGSTSLDLPAPINVTPLDGESIAPSFVAYADSGDGGIQAIALGQRPRGSVNPFTNVGNTNVGAGLPVGPLAAGRYEAKWTLTNPRLGDTATDTYIRTTRFVVQAGNVGPQGTQGTQGVQGTQGTQGVQGTQGAQGAQGPQGAVGMTGVAGANGSNGANGAAGPAGPQGPAGRSVRSVRCRVTRVKPKIKITCTVRFTAAASAKVVRARISRRGTVYASGQAVSRNGHVTLRMRARRAVPKGRYTLTTVTTYKRGRTVTTHAPVTVG
jgi:hypothetical protein